MNFSASQWCVVAVTTASLALGTAGAEEKSADQWAADLGSDSPAIRQKAGAELLALGGASTAVLAQLEKHPDPWVASRATRLLMETRGIDPRLPLRIQRELLDFGKLTEPQRLELFAELKRSGPGHLNALSFLYNRATAQSDLSENETAQWQQYLRYCTSANLKDANTLRTGSLSTATRGVLASCFPDELLKENMERYMAWRAQDEDIRFHLLSNTVDFEISYLKEHGTSADLLGYLPRIIDRKARIRATIAARNAISKDENFKADELSEKASIGYLVILADQGGIGQAQAWYDKHIARLPAMASALPPGIEVLEVNRLFNAKKTMEAMRLALVPNSAEGYKTALGRNLLYEIGRSLGTKPEAFPDGLPAIPDSRSLPWMGGLLESWFPMNRPGAGYSDIEAMVECFDRWAKTDEWLEAARRFGPQPLYHLVMLRRGKLGDALRVHEFEHETAALNNLGALILMRPEIARELPARQCSLITLREILDGAFEEFGTTSPTAWPVIKLAEQWEEFHPDLLAPDGFPGQPLYHAAGVWKKGGHAEAAAALLALTKPIPAESPPGKNWPAASRPNPLASAATCLLADLLGETPDADVKRLLPVDQVSRESFERIFGRLNRKENRSLNRVRSAMAIASLLRECFDLKDKNPLLTSHEARSLARDAWMAGDTPLAAGFMNAAFLSDQDPEELYDATFVPVLTLLGRAGETLEKLDAGQSSMPPTVYQTKRARLLLSLGNPGEAMKTASPDHHPDFRTNLAIRSGDWDAAVRSAFKLDFGSSMKRDAVLATMAVLSDDPELLGRHITRDHPVISLCQGNALRDGDLQDMARDSELAARREARLTGALASGTPVQLGIMADYFRFLDQLPDKQRAIRIALDVSKTPACEINGRTNADGCDAAHKVIAAEALLLLGRGDLAFEAMRPLMQASVAPHGFESASRWSPGAYTKPLVAACRQIIRIAHIEWPRETPVERMERLALVFGRNDPVRRGRGLLEMIFKHEACLEKTELLQALWFPFCDLAQTGVVPDDLKDRARSLVENRQPDEQERHWLESQWLPIPWQMKSSHPPVTGKSITRYSFTPKPGVHSDPKQADFVTIDGISEAAKLHQLGKPAEACNLTRDIVIRLLLDPDTARQEVEWKVITQSGSATHSSGFSNRGLETVLFSFNALGFPPALASPFVDSCTDSWTNYADKDRLLHAARILAKADRHAAALSTYQRYLAFTVPPVGSRDTGVAGREEIAEMQRVRGIVSAKESNSTQTVNSILRLLQLAPYQPEGASDVVAILKQNNDVNTLKSARMVTDDFWKARLIEIPSSATYQYWKQQWEALFP